MTVKISNLPAATSVGSGDVLPVVQSGTTKKVDLNANWSFGGDVNFDSGTLFVDASANKIGIGTTSPASPLHVKASSSNSLRSGNNINLEDSAAGTDQKHFTISSRLGFFSITPWNDAGNQAQNGFQIKKSAAGSSVDSYIFNIGASVPAVTINSSGNVLVGTTTADTTGGGPNLTVKGNTQGRVCIKSNASGSASGDGFHLVIDGAGDAFVDQRENNALTFTTNALERMRIDSSGDVQINTTSQVQSGKLSIQADANQDALAVSHSGGASGAGYSYNSSATTGYAAFFITSSGPAGAIYCSGTTTAFNTSSDYRLKENILPLTGALDKVQAMNPVTYNWKAGGQGEGFIAHELQEIAPYAVSGEKDGEEMQGVDYGKLTTLLVGAVKELTAKVKQLETQLGA